MARAVPAAVLVVATFIGVALVPAGAQQKAKANDVGITDKEIRIAVIADVDNPIVPGLFKAGADAVKAWGATVNQAGGIAGRKVVVDFIDSKLNANETRNAVITACTQDFAMVGTEALSLNNVADLEQCKDAQGQATGMPEFPGIASGAEKCSPVVFYVAGDAKYCATKDQPDVTYTAQQGDYRYYLSQFKDLHGIWLTPADSKPTKDAAVPSYIAGVNLGIKKDGEGFYDVFARDPQSSLTPFMNLVKQDGSTFVYAGSSASKMVQARQEANIQGVNSVKVWACHVGCYDTAFLQTGRRRRGRHQLDPDHAALLLRVQVEPLAEELRQAGGRRRQAQQLRDVGVGRGAPVPGRGREGGQGRHAHPGSRSSKR